MGNDCNHQCGNCSSDCGDKTTSKANFLKQPHELSSVKKVIAVMSGKGGVGKSLVTSLLAAAMQKQGYHSAILDADITGPSIPKAFGLTEKAIATEAGILPVKTSTGIATMSVNLLLERETDPVIWRGPIIAGTVAQFWTDVIWKDVDFLFIDMPPGTGDVPLTVFQSIPVDGIIVVTSPQELVSMIVTKAVNMAKQMQIPILGIVENFSYFTCPDNGKNYAIFGDSHIDEIAKTHAISGIAKLPINPDIAAACDQGHIETLNIEAVRPIQDILEKLLPL